MPYNMGDTTYIFVCESTGKVIKYEATYEIEPDNQNAKMFHDITFPDRTWMRQLDNKIFGSYRVPDREEVRQYLLHREETKELDLL
jgi:hypothetical protein